jgi:hypothetical protein
MASKARMAKMFLPVAAVVALATACPNGDATPGQVVEAMTNANLDRGDANCIGEEFEDSFTQEQLNEIAGATDLDDIPTSLADEVRSILADCLDGGGNGDAGDDPDEADAGTEGDDTGGDDTDGGDTDGNGE